MPATDISVYAGRRLLGFVRDAEMGKGYVARGVDWRELGRFKTVREASQAISATAGTSTPPAANPEAL